MMLNLVHRSVSLLVRWIAPVMFARTACATGSTSRLCVRTWVCTRGLPTTANRSTVSLSVLAASIIRTHLLLHTLVSPSNSIRLAIHTLDTCSRQWARVASLVLVRTRCVAPLKGFLVIACSSSSRTRPSATTTWTTRTSLLDAKARLGRLMAVAGSPMAQSDASRATRIDGSSFSFHISRFANRESWFGRRDCGCCLSPHTAFTFTYGDSHSRFSCHRCSLYSGVGHCSVWSRCFLVTWCAPLCLACSSVLASLTASA